MIDTKQQNDRGYYAVVPRIVRAQYKQLTHADKWLYTCLRDLSGKKGTCFRSLRSLSEETDISIASLSTMIPKLHKAGLIHAEKKRRSITGKEVWHITVIDIWQANADYCSKIEQSSVEEADQPHQFVQNPNNVVQELNKEGVVCSEIERDCSNFPHRRIYIEDSNNKDKNIDSSVMTANADHHEGIQTQPLPSVSTDLEETVKQPAIKPKQADSEPLTQGKQFKTISKKKAAPPKPEPTPEEKALTARSTAIYNHIVEWRGYAFDNGGAVINERKYCHKLAEKYSDEQIPRIYEHLTTKDFKWSKPNYRYKVGAYEIFTEAGSVLQQLKASDKTASNGHMPAMPRDKNETRVISSFGTPGFDFAAEFYPSEAEKRAARAAQQ